MVGARLRSQKVTVTDYTDDATTTDEIAWSEAGPLPAPVFDATFVTAAVPWRDDGAATH